MGRYDIEVRKEDRFRWSWRVIDSITDRVAAECHYGPFVDDRAYFRRGAISAAKRARRRLEYRAPSQWERLNI